MSGIALIGAEKSSCTPSFALQHTRAQQEEYMEKAQLMLKKAGRRLTVVSRQSRSWLMLWVVLFGIGLFFVV